MKKFLSLLTALSLTTISLSTVVACGKKEVIENSLTDQQIEMYIDKYKSTVKNGVDAYFSSIYDNFIFSSSNANISGKFGFFNLDIMGKLAEGTNLHLGQASYLEVLKNDYFLHFVRLKDIQKFVSDEFRKNSEYKILSQFEPKSGIVKGTSIGQVTFSKVKSTSSESYNYTFNIPTTITYSYLNKDNIEVNGNTIIKEVSLTILSDEDIVRDINEAIAKFSIDVFTEKNSILQIEPNDLKLKKKPYDPTPQIIYDYFWEQSDWFKNKLQGIFDNQNITVIGAPTIEDESVSLISNMYSSKNPTPIDWKGSDGRKKYLVNNLLLRKDSDWDNFEELYQYPMTKELEIQYGADINSDNFLNEEMNYFFSNGFNENDIEKRTFEDTFAYGSFSIKNVEIQFDALNIKLTPIRLLFTYGDDNVSKEEFFENILLSINYLFLELGIVENTNNGGFWSFSNSDIWNEIKNKIVTSTSTSNKLTTDDLFKKIFDLEISKEVLESDEFYFNTFSLSVYQGWNLAFKTGEGITLGDRQNKDDPTKRQIFRIQVGNFTISLSPKPNDVAEWSVVETNGNFKYVKGFLSEYKEL